MNTKSIVVLVTILAWSGVCWTWYVMGIKGKYGSTVANAPKQDTVIQKTVNIQDTSTMDTVKSVQILDQKTLLYFKEDSINFEKDTLIKNYLTKLSQKLIIVKDTVVTILGHSDVLGDSVAQSYQNARAVQAFMLSKGAPPSKIKLEALGDKNPVVKDSTEQARYRRIEIFFNKKPQ